MPNLRSILSLILVVITTLLVSCAPSATAPPPTYTPEKIAQIQTYLEPVLNTRERMTELGDLIQDRNWVDVDSDIHGPLGFLRRDIRYLSETLLPEDQKAAKKIAKNLFSDFDRINSAAKDQNYYFAAEQFNEAIRDFDAYLNLIPKAEDNT